MIFDRIAVKMHVAQRGAFFGNILSISFLNFSIMGNLLYLIAVILIIGWAVGVFAYSATGIIHVLLVIAIIAILLNIIRSAKA